jgi:hypothetical protein
MFQKKDKLFVTLFEILFGLAYRVRSGLTP